MAALLVILLLTSGYVTLCSQIHREYCLVNVAKTWNEAQSYCRNSYTDLATVGSHDDMHRLVNMVSTSGETKEVWIGMRETGPASWLWSVGETQTSDGVVEYTNWASLPNSADNCGGMRNDGKWFSAPCATTLPYLCQDEGSSWLYADFQTKNWIDAQSDCRLSNKNLVSLRNPTENLALQQIISDIHNRTSLSLFWIGLFRDEWKWSDQSNSSFRSWASDQPNNDGVCSLYNPLNKGFMDRGCTYPKPFICHNVIINYKQKSIKFVNVEMKSSLDLNDLSVREAILEQIQSKYQDAKVQWRVQPDGKIFHKKKVEKKIKDTC